jgi:hypothetical protein
MHSLNPACVDVLCCNLAVIGLFLGCSAEKSATALATTAEEAIRNETRTSIEAGRVAREYEASENARGLQAPNRAYNLRTYFEPEGIRVQDRTAEGSPELLSLRLEAMGRGDVAQPVELGEVTHEGTRLEIRRPDLGLVEWYGNMPRGLEQGFTLESRLEGAGDFWVR